MPPSDNANNTKTYPQNQGAIYNNLQFAKSAVDNFVGDSRPQPFGEQAIIDDIPVVLPVKQFILQQRVKRKAHA